PFKFFWHNLAKIKHKIIEVNQLEEEINEDRIKHARKVKAPKFQYLKNLEKIDFSEFEKEQSKELNSQYAKNLKMHVDKLYKDHIENLTNFVNSIGNEGHQIQETIEFPFKISLYNNPFSEAQTLFNNLYAEGLIVLNNCLEKTEKKRIEKLSKNKQGIQETLGDVITERIKAQIGP
ncbi:5790_t:CDS:2, partial [Scutellospora calospora]